MNVEILIKSVSLSSETGRSSALDLGWPHSSLGILCYRKPCAYLASLIGFLHLLNKKCFANAHVYSLSVTGTSVLLHLSHWILDRLT